MTSPINLQQPEVERFTLSDLPLTDLNQQLVRNRFLSNTCILQIKQKIFSLSEHFTCREKISKFTESVLFEKR